MNPDRVSLCVKHPDLHASAAPEDNPHCFCFSEEFLVAVCLVFNPANSICHTVVFRKSNIFKSLLSEGHMLFGLGQALMSKSGILCQL